MTAQVFLATCSELPDGDEDGAELLAACAAAGLDASWRVWDDPAVDWAAADLVVVRSVWDYTNRRDEFLTWADSVPRLANPAAVLRWNSDKRYLADLADAGVAVIPTAWAPPGTPIEVPHTGEYVVKPSVGAGSRGAARFRADDPSDSFAAAIHVASLQAAGLTVMVQPYLDAVDDVGETALVYLGGQFSHAIGKAAMLAPSVVHAADGPALYVAEDISKREPSSAERAVADQVLAAAPPDLLYARVDLLPAPSGPVLIELELTEPSLFLDRSTGAADRLAAAIAAYLARPDADRRP